MPLYYFTFGQKYRQESHPAGGHPDGWFTVNAKDSQEAREKMVATAGIMWAAQYDKEPDIKVFPKGEIRRI